MTTAFALSLFGLSLFSLGAVACGSPCEDLQEICDDCRDPNHKANCERSVDEDPDDLCEQNIDSYRNICR